MEPDIGLSLVVGGSLTVAYIGCRVIGDATLAHMYYKESKRWESLDQAHKNYLLELRNNPDFIWWRRPISKVVLNRIAKQYQL